MKKFFGDACSKAAIQIDFNFNKKIDDKAITGKKDGDKVKLDLPPEAL